MNQHFAILRLAIDHFDEWANTVANRRSSDWPTDYPAMGELVQAAAFAMFCACEEPLTRDEDLALIARVWSLTQEPESMVEEAIELGQAVGPVLRRLFAVGDHEARWQIVSAVPRIGVLDVELLQLGTRDADAYVRRRAWIALHEVSPPLAMAGATRALGTEFDDDLRTVLREIVAGAQ